MTIRRASCSCGQLTLMTEGEPVRISMCHCYACQRRTGSAFGTQARFPRDSVTVEGHSNQYIRIADDGDAINFYFCPHCGSTVYYESNEDSDLIAVPVGAFADRNFPSPTVSVYEARAHGWVSLPEDVEHYD